MEGKMLLCSACKAFIRDPVLLPCLHSCCSKCLDARVNSAEKEDSITCPTCKQVTVTTNRFRNLFLAHQVARSREALQSFSNCDICKANGKVDELPEAWCIECQHSLCCHCIQDHGAVHACHAIIRLPSDGYWDGVQESPYHCQKHNEALRLVCRTCRTLMCVECSHDCLGIRHDVQPLNSSRIASYTGKLKEEIQRLLGALDEKCGVLQQQQKLVEGLMIARDQELEKLKQTKKLIADTLESVYFSAEQSLKEAYDTALTRATKLHADAEVATGKVSCALKYGQFILDSRDVTGLLHQHRLLLTSLQSLVKEVVDVQAPKDASKIVTVDRSLPPDINSLMCSWLGKPVLDSDDLCSSATDKADPMKCSTASHSMGTAFDELNDDFLETQHFGRPFSSFCCPDACYDVAVTANDSLLLAMNERGLVEFDFGGKELSSWIPKKRGGGDGDDCVWSVDVLCDGRVAADIVFSLLIVLLRRVGAVPGGCTWLEEKIIDLQLQSPAWCLSVHSDFLALAESQRNEQNWNPGRSMVLAKLCCGQVLLRKKLDYTIQSLAVTPSALVTASGMSVELGDGRSGYIVDCFSHSGIRLWRHEPGGDVLDMHVASSGRVVYLALSDSTCLVTLDADDGQLLKSIVSSSSNDRSQDDDQFAAGKDDNAAVCDGNAAGLGSLAVDNNGDSTESTVDIEDDGKGGCSAVDDASVDDSSDNDSSNSSSTIKSPNRFFVRRCSMPILAMLSESESDDNTVVTVCRVESWVPQS